MKTKLIILTITAMLLVGNVFAQEAESVGAEGLDLNAVAELFKDSESLESFEKNLNDSDNGLNNLDLDENGEVDYLRVEENVEGGTHLIALQSVLDEDETQDVAIIAVEKEVNNYNFQIQGTPEFYGANYYVVPSYRDVSGWNLIKWMFLPNNRPYRSAFGWRRYPTYWRVRRPVTYNIYRTRTVRFVGKKNFTRSKTVRVKTVSKVKYTPKTSTKVKKKTVVKSNGNKTVVKQKRVKKTTDNKTGTTTVKKGKKKTVETSNGKKTKTKKVKKKKN